MLSIEVEILHQGKLDAMVSLILKKDSVYSFCL